MSRPNINFLAQHFLIPNLEYSFSLQLRDFRLLWGIFCGATSNVSEIPIYTPERLDAQLDAILRYSCCPGVLFCKIIWWIYIHFCPLFSSMVH